MAEIHVERKDRSMLPMVLAALTVLALLAWWLMGRNGDGDSRYAMNDSTGVMADSAAGLVNNDTAGLGTMPVAVQQLDRYVRDQQVRSAGLAHEYTATGLRQLADAIEAVARERNANVDLQPRLAVVRERADELQRDANANDHALRTREAFLLIANLVRDVHADSAATATAMTNVQQAAEAIDAKRPLLDQTDQVQQFFERSSRSLRDLYARAN